MKKVLIITYYWPPSGGSGVQRWLKMSKYLSGMGWLPVIYTAENAEYPVEDPSMEKEVPPEATVIKRPIVEPYNAYKKFMGIKKEKKIKAGFLSTEEKPFLKENIARWVRGNLFIPDARCFWVKPSVKYLLSYLKKDPVDAIISTGPPHSMHLIGKHLHEKTGIPWIADFRDPWTEIDFYEELKLSRWADKKQHRLEKEVLTGATEVVSIGWTMAKNLAKTRKGLVEVIPNGFDFEGEKSLTEQRLTDKFTLTHIGITPPSRNVDMLWATLSDMINEVDSFADRFLLKFIGPIDISIKTSLNKYHLDKYTETIGHIAHDRIIGEQCSSQVLLLLINNTPNSKSILTGKLYEYLFSGRPILAIGPVDGDAGRIIKETNAGDIVDYSDKEGLKTKITDLFMRYLSDGLPTKKRDNIERYSRKYQASEYVELLDRLKK